MNIAMFTDCYTPTKNGVVTSILQLKEGLERRSHKVIVVTVGTSQTFSNESNIYRFPSISFNSDIEIHLGRVKLKAVLDILQKEKIELVHTHTEFTVARVAKKAAKKLKLPLLHTLHTNFHDYRHYLPFGRFLLPGFMLNMAYKQFLKEYQVVICPSEKAELFIQAINSNKKTFVIANGADRKRFHPKSAVENEKQQLKLQRGLNPDDKVMLYVGRIAREKRSVVLVKSLIPLLKVNRTMKLMLVGSGGEREKVQQIVKEHYLNQQILLNGWVEWEAMPEIYRMADLFVTASLSEICPMTIIEAMMSGLPVIARRDKALEGLVQEGKSGCLVDSDHMLEGKILKLLNKKSLYLDYSKRALELSSRFNNSDFAARMEAIYNAV